MPRLELRPVSPSQLQEEMKTSAQGLNWIMNDAKSCQVQNKKRASITWRIKNPLGAKRCKGSGVAR